MAHRIRISSRISYLRTPRGKAKGKKNYNRNNKKAVNEL